MNSPLTISLINSLKGLARDAGTRLITLTVVNTYRLCHVLGKSIKLKRLIELSLGNVVSSYRTYGSKKWTKELQVHIYIHDRYREKCGNDVIKIA